MLCAITVEHDDRPATVTSSTDVARQLDEKQYEFDDGPCLSALRRQEVVIVQDLQSDHRWEGYADAVAVHGVRSVLAHPIATDNGAGAALNCYSTEVNAFGPETVQAIGRHAESLSAILRLALRLHSNEPYPEQLKTVLQNRAVVDAAISLIMFQNRCNREAAVKLLHMAARNSDLRLHAIAQDLLAQAKETGPVPGT